MYVLGRGMPVKTILDAVRFTVAECRLTAMQGDPVHAYYLAGVLSGIIKLDVGKNITMSHTLDAPHLISLKSLC